MARTATSSTRTASTAARRAEQVILDPNDTVQGDWTRDSNRGYREISTDITYNGNSTLLYVPAKNDKATTILSQTTHDAASATTLDFKQGWFTIPIYIRPKDFARWNASGGMTFYYLISNEIAGTTNYVQMARSSAVFRAGWNYFCIPVNKDLITGDQLGIWIDDPLDGGDGITTQTGRVIIRIDLSGDVSGGASNSGKRVVGTSISSIDTTDDQVIFSAAHDLSDGDAIFFAATTVPGGTTQHVPYFVDVIDTTTVELYTEPALTNKVDITTAGADVLALHAPHVYIGPSTYGQYRHPHVVISIDDATEETFTEWYEGASLTEGLKALEWDATPFIISGSIGGANSMTVAQVKELYDAGWSIGNHSSTADDFTAITLAQAKTNVETCKDYISGKGWGKGDILAYPSNIYRDSANGYDDSILSAVRAAGIKYARSGDAAATSTGILTLWAGRQDHADLKLSMYSIPCDATHAVADALVDLDHAISIGMPIIFIMVHKITAGAAGSNITPADADTLIAGLKSRLQKGLISIVNAETAIENVLGDTSRS